MFRKIAITFVGCLLTLVSLAQSPFKQTDAAKRWVDSVYNTLTIDQKIGQLFMVAAYSDGRQDGQHSIEKLIKDNHIGGLIFMQGTAEKQAALTNQYQKMSKVPLLIGMDAEWGLGMRLKGVKDLPRQQMLGATDDTALVYEMGKVVAQQCKRLGVHINFAPSVDINNNPNNPIINFRSFGDDKYLVSRLGLAYTKGMQDNGVLANAKHFPGHGNTAKDSHHELPTISQSKDALTNLELFPFKQLIDGGVKSIMVAHMNIPSIVETPGLPTTLSYNTITNILKKEMGFQGLIFTDALNMKGVSQYAKAENINLMALKAGNDVLLFAQDVPEGIRLIKQAFSNAIISEERIAQSVKKILLAKYEAGLHQWTPIVEANATKDINMYTDAFRVKTARKAITLAKSSTDWSSLIQKAGSKIQYVAINGSASTPFFENLNLNLKNHKSNFLPKGSTNALSTKIYETLKEQDLNIVAIHDVSFYPKGAYYGLDAIQVDFLRKVINKDNVLIVLFGNSYLLKDFCQAQNVVLAFENDEMVQGTCADMILGKVPFQGKISNIPCVDWAKETSSSGTSSMVGEKKKLINDLRKSTPQEAGVVNQEALVKLNTFIQQNITDGTFPGCRLLASKDGKVFYNQAFGNLTYSGTHKVELNTVYDVASVTKVAATTLAVMKLFDEGKIKLSHTIGDYLNIAKGSNIENITIRDLLLHQGGLEAWIPFYKTTLDSNGNWHSDYYSTSESAQYPWRLAPKLYINKKVVDTIWAQTLNSKLPNKGKYVYSDLDFILLAAIVERITNTSIDYYVTQTFYKPLGLKHTLFEPYGKIGLNRIAPTEQDNTFRKGLVHGFVHDQAAALLGGVSGHAGLFSTADDLAVICQMLLNGGVYGGKRYLKAETVEQFTKYNTRLSRRGLGFDKPNPSNSNAGPVGDRVGGMAFGHQGFTGTCVWADPETGIVFVFLSNRVYPKADNNKINSKSVRTVAQDYIYQAFNINNAASRTKLYKF